MCFFSFVRVENQRRSFVFKIARDFSSFFEKRKIQVFVSSLFFFFEVNHTKFVFLLRKDQSFRFIRSGKQRVELVRWIRYRVCRIRWLVCLALSRSCDWNSQELIVLPSCSSFRIEFGSFEFLELSLLSFFSFLLQSENCSSVELGTFRECVVRSRVN